MSTDRIEAAVQAEARRIKAHLSTIQRPELETVPFIRIVGPASVEEYVESLANHLVRNRLQIEVLQVAALVEALAVNSAIVDWFLSHSEDARRGMLRGTRGDQFIEQMKEARNQAQAALAAKELTP